MRELPIIFNDEMVRAIINGDKTVTRRPVKSNSGPPPTMVHRKQGPSGRHWTEPGGWVRPPAAVGDVLYVREAWGLHLYGDYTCWLRDSVRGRSKDDLRASYEVAYRADATSVYDYWRPSILMPRWAARLFLRVTSVRVERVQAITEDGARAEGCFFDGHAWFPGEWHGMPGFAHGRDAFATLWDGIYAAKGLGWEANPWCWVIEFDRIEDYRGEEDGR